MRTILAIIFLFSTHTIAYSQAPQDSVALKVNWKTIKTKNYSLQYPPNWILNQGDPGGAAVILYARMPKKANDFVENVNLMIQDLSDRNLNLDSYTVLSERQVHTLVENSKLIKSERVDSLKHEFHQITYTGDFDKHQLKWHMRFWVVKDEAYVLTYTSTKENFGLYAERAVEIMETFKLR